jgi:hypothetical protein
VIAVAKRQIKIKPKDKKNPTNALNLIKKIVILVFFEQRLAKIREFYSI